MMFSRNKKIRPVTDEPECLSLEGVNPWVNARRAWNSHTAGLMSALQLWQFIGIGSLLITTGAVGGLVYMGSQTKFIPLVFQQDKSGNTLSMTRADRVPDAKLDDYRIAASRFIENIRLVTVDSELQRKAILETYAFLSTNDPSLAKANEYLNGTKEANPFHRAISEMVSVEIQAVLKQSSESWQVDWIETSRNRDGSLKAKPLLMRAIVTLYQNQSTHETTTIEALRNPHFIFVRDFNWSKQSFY